MEATPKTDSSSSLNTLVCAILFSASLLLVGCEFDEKRQPGPDVSPTAVAIVVTSTAPGADITNGALESRMYDNVAEYRSSLVKLFDVGFTQSPGIEITVNDQPAVLKGAELWIDSDEPGAQSQR
ncbi:MAG: hypothetical protein ACOCXT_05475 [Candidatus Dojkabacteria bacterium]